MTMQIHLKNVRLAFPQLWEPKQVNGQGEPAYSASLLLSPDDPQADTVNALIDKVGEARWGAKAKTVLATLRGTDKVALHDGDTKAEYTGFEGMYFISARSKVAPLVINSDRTPLLANSGRPYAGCYVNAIVELWAQDNQFGKRVNASLKGIQFWRDGEAFAGTPPANIDDFDDCSVDDGAGLV
jgi:hypothetical protein